jgi:hypothetical protein
VEKLDSNMQQETCSSSKQAVYKTLKSGVQVIQTSLASDQVASDSTAQPSTTANNTSDQQSESTVSCAQPELAQQQQLQQQGTTTSSMADEQHISTTSTSSSSTTSSSTANTTEAPAAAKPQPQAAVQAKSQGPVQQVCCVCQDSHFVCNMGKPVDGYLVGQHMVELPDGRWVELQLGQFQTGSATNAVRACHKLNGWRSGVHTA